MFTNEGFPYSMLHSRDDLVHGFSDESADDELENLLRKKLNKSKYQRCLKNVVIFNSKTFVPQIKVARLSNLKAIPTVSMNPPSQVATICFYRISAHGNYTNHFYEKPTTTTKTIICHSFRFAWISFPWICLTLRYVL